MFEEYIITSKVFPCFGLGVPLEHHRALYAVLLHSFLEGEQEVHDLSDLGQLSDPLSELLDVGLQAFNRCILWVAGRPPELARGFQQLARHQVGEVRRPQLGDPGNRKASWPGQGHVPVRKGQFLIGEVQPVHRLMGQKQPLSVLPLLPTLLQRLNPQPHHLSQLQVLSELQLHLILRGHD